MATNGIDFEKKFGERWNAMTPDERNMAIYLAITDFYSITKKLDTTCSTVANHGTYWKIAIWLATVFFAGLVSIGIKVIFNL